MGTFGNTAIGASSLSLDQNSKYAGRFYKAATGYITSFKVHAGADAGAAAVFRVAVYADSAGAAGALLGTATAISVPAGSAKAWRTLIPIGSLCNAVGYYWLGVQTQDYRLNLSYSSTGGTSQEKADLYSDGPSDPFGGSGVGTRKLSIYAEYAGANVAPNAPAITYPTDAETINVDISHTFSWTFSDDNAGDSQSAYNHRYRIVGAPAWTTTGWVASPYAQHVYAGGTFLDGEDYEHQAQTKDALGVEGPWCASALFFASTVAGLPIITAPAVDETITTSLYPMVWSIADQAAVEIRVLADDAGSPDEDVVLWDSGGLVSPTARTYDVPFDIAGGGVQHVQINVFYAAVWTGWATARVNVAALPPARPVCTVTGSDSGGYIAVSATHPEPSGGQPTVTSMDILRTLVDPDDDSRFCRIAAGLVPTATYLDYAVASGVEYEYAVRAIADTGAYTDSNAVIWVSLAAPTALVFVGDSTGDAATEWIYLFSEWLASQSAHLSFKYLSWSDAAQAWGLPETLQTGAAGDRYAVLGSGGATDCYAPTSTAFDVTDLDVRVFLTAADYTPAAIGTLAYRGGVADPNRQWAFQVLTDGTLRLTHWPTGSAASALYAVSTAAITTVIDNGDRVGLRVTLDANNGAGGWSVKFYWSIDEGVTWTQLGSTVTTATATTLPAVTGQLQIGGINTSLLMAANFHSLQLLDSIDGTLVAYADMGQPTTDEFTDICGNLWTFRAGVPTFGGAYSVLLLNGSVAGQAISYFTNVTRWPLVCPDIDASWFFINLGHVNDVNNEDYPDEYQGLIDDALARYPDAEPFLYIQNPQAEAAPGQVNHTARMAMVRAIAIAEGYAYADVFNAFLATPDWETDLMTDQVHPNAAGSALGALTVEAVRRD